MNDRYRLIESGFDPAAAALASDENAYRVLDRLTDEEYRVLASHLAARPDAWLWIEDQSADLEFLEYFHGLRQLRIAVLRLQSYDGLRHVAACLQHLSVGDTLKPLSIAVLGECRGLQSLAVIGPVTDARVVGSLGSLTELSLRSVTLPGLDALLSLRRLRSLALLLGGMSDLSLLPRPSTIEELELWRIRGLTDVSSVAALSTLQVLRLQSMSGVTELPSFRNAPALRSVYLDTMKGITDLQPVADAPKLERLYLVEMPQLTAESLRPFVGHPTLRDGRWGLGSKRKNIEAFDLLPIGDPPYGHPTWQEWMQRQATASEAAP